MADVFISYSREDRPRAEHVARALSALGLDPFWDTDIPPGQTWADYIEGKLSNCKAVVVLWSQHSTKSQWVREEARMGRDRAKLFPALLDGTPAPFGFGEVQAANLSHWTGDAGDAEWRRFANAVHQAVRGAPAPAPAQSSAPAYAPAPQPRPAYAAPSPGAGAPGAESTPIDYIKKCIRLYFNGKGRARRAEYWWWILFTVIVAVVAAVIDISLFGFNPYTNEPNMQVVSLAAGLAVLPASISAMSRRFHDVGLSGWLVAGVFGGYLLGAVAAEFAEGLGVLIVLLVFIAALVVTVLPSKPGANQYGPNPKGV